jgi:hypothetical protein
MATKTINIYPIKIMLDTNIPGATPGATSGATSGADAASFIPFDKSLIHSSAGPGSAPLQTGSFNNYPYFTMDVKYPETYLQNLPYDKRYEFFFNKQMMTRVLKSQPVLQLSSDSSSSADAEVAVKSDDSTPNAYNELIQKLKLPQETNASIDEVIKDISNKITELRKQIKLAAESGSPSRETSAKWTPKVFTDNVPKLLDFFEGLNSVKPNADVSGVLNILNDVNNMQLANITELTQIQPDVELLKKIGKINTEITNDIDMSKIKSIVTGVLTAMKKKIDEESKIQKSEIQQNQNTQNDMRIKNQQYENGEFNILCMIRTLFSTKYPFSGNNLSSFQMIVKRNPEFNFKFSDFLPGFVKEAFQPITYTYLKINGKIYTVTQTVWINDIYNHPDYKVLVQKFQTLMAWKENERIKLEKDIGEQMKKFKDPEKNKSQEHNFTESDITEISGQIKGFDDPNITREIQTSYINFNNAIKTMIKAIEAFNTSINGTDIMVILDNANNLKMAYDDLLKLGFKPKQRYTTIINNIQKQLDIVQTNEFILNNYMKTEGINLNYENEKDIYKQRLKEKFGKYVDFAETIKQFTVPNKETTNVFLQETVDKFLKNTDNVFNDIMNIEKFGSIPQGLPTYEKKVFEKRKNTGITIVYDKNQPIYEIFLQVNCIGGELTDDNKSAIDCLYKDDFLGNRMEYLVNESVSNIWEINTNRVYFDLEDARVQEKIQAATATTASAAVGKQAPNTLPKTPVKKGGTRKARTEFIKHYGTRRFRW